MVATSDLVRRGCSPPPSPDAQPLVSPMIRRLRSHSLLMFSPLPGHGSERLCSAVKAFQGPGVASRTAWPSVTGSGNGSDATTAAQ